MTVSLSVIIACCLTPVNHNDWQHLKFVYQTCIQAEQAIDHKVIKYVSTQSTVYYVSVQSHNTVWTVLKPIHTVSVCPKKSIPDIFDCNLKWIFLIQLANKWPFSFPPRPTFVSALPAENTTSEISLFYPMQYDCLINIMHKNTFCSHFWHCGWHVMQLSILTVCSKIAWSANTGKETLSPFTDSSIDKVLLQTNPGCTSRFLTSQTFLNFIW